jgi:HTH-type transcriptional regulator/antitoxin HipB
MARPPAIPSTSTRIRTPEELGALVRAIRLEAGLDQATAAGLAGVGTRFLGDIERGKPTVRLGLVLQVLERLGLELSVRRRGGETP